jgi:N6-L-threonylcarbamoyladenine synthase
MFVLGIESSCDETAAAIVEDGRRLVANAVASQVPIHARYGGVVPELASRAHIVDIVPVVQRCLDEAGMTLDDLDGIAVTAGPGLVGSLLVGTEFAKSLASTLDIPLVGVNHIEGHLLAPFLDYDGPDDISGTPEYPFLGLVVSGGHSHLFHARAVGDYELVGATRDDAAGEAYDKVAKMIGLPYPGGVYIDRAAQGGNSKAIRFPRALPQKDNHEFSFSGLKTSVLNHVRKNGVPDKDTPEFADLCASFQEAVVDVLVTKTFRKARLLGVKHVVISGGVSANSRLRARALQVAGSNGVAVHIPPIALCTDNAAMIASLGWNYLKDRPRAFAAWTLNASSSLPMGRAIAD